VREGGDVREGGGIREGGGGRPEGRPDARVGGDGARGDGAGIEEGAGIPGLNGIVRGGGSGALMRPARGAAGLAGADGVLVAEVPPPARAF